jgi:hypothetical protein
MADDKTEPLIIECSPQMRQILGALVLSGLFGPSVETCAQRLLELKLYEISIPFMQRREQ